MAIPIEPLVAEASAEYGPWTPGITSQLPASLSHLTTLYRPENSYTDVAKAIELHDLTGLDVAELVALRPRRLALHEILVRVTADLSVPDGNRIEDLGINFRQMTRTILTRYVEPMMPAIGAAHDAVKIELRALVQRELDVLLGPSRPAPAPVRTPSFFPRFRRRRVSAPVVDVGPEAQQRLVTDWEAKGHRSADSLQEAGYRALARVSSALIVRHGAVWGSSRELIASLAVDLAANDFGSEAIGRLIAPRIAEAAAQEGYAVLPRQAQPVVMNTKGASASGKSTMRPLQKKLAGDIGVLWSDFALISPDIWRKQLLDYGELGSAYKYAGTLTGEELQIVDQKLDRYMARKAQRGDMSHLLIDRFRFDSFAPDSDEPGSNLLTRFGHIVYLFFMITPPESLVERAWKRGLEFGRYKAIDDTLAHGVEAYTGMPQLFHTWARRSDKRVQFEFLDNTVPLGERPRTIAFGGDGTLNVMDVKSLLDIERFQRVFVDATAPERLYRDCGQLAADNNTRFLRQCRDRFAEVNFADRSTGRIYLRLRSGTPVWADPDALAQAGTDPDTRAGLAAVVPGVWSGDLGVACDAAPQYLRHADDGGVVSTVGTWGDGAPT